MDDESPPVMVRMTGVILARVTQTAVACPSQWDAWDAEGNYYYLRYRRGCGDVRQYQTANWVEAPLRDDADQSEAGWAYRANPEYVRHVASFEYGHPLDGSISLECFCALAGLRLAPALQRTSYGQHLTDQLILGGLPVGKAEALGQLMEPGDE